MLFLIFLQFGTQERGKEGKEDGRMIWLRKLVKVGLDWQGKETIAEDVGGGLCQRARKIIKIKNE